MGICCGYECSGGTVLSSVAIFELFLVGEQGSIAIIYAQK